MHFSTSRPGKTNENFGTIFGIRNYVSKTYKHTKFGWNWFTGSAATQWWNFTVFLTFAIFPYNYAFGVRSVVHLPSDAVLHCGALNITSVVITTVTPHRLISVVRRSWTRKAVLGRWWNAWSSQLRQCPARNTVYCSLRNNFPLHGHLLLYRLDLNWMTELNWIHHNHEFNA